MKKTLLLLCMAVGLMSCTSEGLNPENEKEKNEGVPMTFNVTVLDTKADKADWANGDIIYVFFKGLANKYLILEYDGSSWTNTSGGGTLLSTDFVGLSEFRLTAVHFPVAVDVTYSSSSFHFKSGGDPVYNYYLFDENRMYSVSGTTVNATLSMGKPADMVQIHVAGIQGSVGDYTFGCSKIRPVACESVGSALVTIQESVLQAGARVSGVADSDGGIFAGRLVYPGTDKDYKFTLASDTQIYTLTRADKALTAGKMYNFPALSETGGSNWAVTDVSDLYVDLGLSVKWAKCNLGAASETGYGDYFAYGETTGTSEGKTNFAWGTYAWGTGAKTLTKYCSSAGYGVNDGIYTLLPEDDAAYAALGGKFRMPTRVECKELADTKSDGNYTWTWSTNYKSSGIKGYEVKRNSTEATIFLPAAGEMNGSSTSGVASEGRILSSNYNTSTPNNAYYLYFFSGSASGEYYSADRCHGRSIRPISE